MITKAEAQAFNAKREVAQVELWVKDNEGNIDQDLKYDRLQASLSLPVTWSVPQRQLALKLISDKYTPAGWHCRLHIYVCGDDAYWAISVTAEKPKSLLQRIFGKGN
jgi:hypothetical protein